MNGWKVIDQKFNTEFRNGSTFATNPDTDFTVDLKANVGELVKVRQTIEIYVTVNPDEVQLIQFNSTADATYGEFVGTGINFMNEGLYTGAVIDVFGGGMAGTPIASTVGLITGPGFNTLRVTKANLLAAGLVDGYQGVDIVIRLTSVPDTLIYKYGLNPNGSTAINYTSWFDTNEQAYFLGNLTGSFQSMAPVGAGIISWNLSASVQAKFVATVGTYYNQYAIEHIFRMPYYTEGEYNNIDNVTAPARFNGTATVTYDNGWFFGGTTLGSYIKAETKGGLGNAGYFKESYNGYANNFLIQNVAIANVDNSGVLEGTVANTLTFQIKNTIAVNFTTSSKVILYHSKLPTESEYANKPTAFDTLWMFERLVTIESSGAVSGTIITNYNLTINGVDPTILDVTAQIQYTTAQQLLILNGSNYLVWISVGNEGAINPDNRVALPVSLNYFSKNLDVPGLITAVDVTHYEPINFDAEIVPMASETGWNGDLIGLKFIVTRSTTIAAVICMAQYRIRAKNSVTNEVFYFEDYDVTWNFNRIAVSDVGGVQYQIMNKDDQGPFNLPADEKLNRLTAATVVPGSAGATQTYTFRTGFQMPWRQWQPNPNVDNSLYDVSEEQNNQNYRVSNYSNVDNWEIRPVFEVTVLTAGNVETIYQKQIAEANIQDFDTTAGTFSATTEYYDGNSELTEDIYVDQNVSVVQKFVHNLGVITLANIEAYVWIERAGSLAPPVGYLHSHLDWSDPSNAITPSDALSVGNTQFVEVFSANNLITLRCYTNRDNLQKGATYNIYGRIKNKTVA